MTNNTKQCSSCQTKKALSEFHSRVKSIDGKQSRCKDCNRLQRKAYYKSAHGKNRNATTGKRMQQKRKLLIYTYLTKHPCVDCGETDPIVLEFDHKDNVDKISDVSSLAHRGFSEAKIIAEIDKCDVRCANCHRRRTAIQFGWYKYISVGNVGAAPTASSV